MVVSAVSVIRGILSTAFAAGALTAVYVFAPSTPGDPVVQYSAIAVNMAAPSQPQPTPVDITVNRWSTASERDQLWTVLNGQGPDQLWSALQNTPTLGFLTLPDALSYDLHYAWHTPMPGGGERVVLGTDRPIGYPDVSSPARTVQYPFTIIELHLHAGGGVEARTSLATKVTADPDARTVRLEHWSAADADAPRDAAAQRLAPRSPARQRLETRPSAPAARPLERRKPQHTDDPATTARVIPTFDDGRRSGATTYTGSLAVESEPAGARVFINQIFVGTSPLVISRIRAGFGTRSRWSGRASSAGRAASRSSRDGRRACPPRCASSASENTRGVGWRRP